MSADVLIVGAVPDATDALHAFLRELPVDFPMAVVVASAHPLPENLLLPASEAEDKEPIERCHIYFSPPDYHLLLDEGRVALSREPPLDGRRPALAPLFGSAGESHGAGSIGLLITTSGLEGSESLREFRLCGGAAAIAVAGELPADIRELKRDGIEFLTPEGAGAWILDQCRLLPARVGT